MRPSPPRDRGTSRPCLSAGEVRRRVQSLLGFAVNAGRVTAGFALTQQALARGEVGFVLAAADLAPRRLAALIGAARERGVTCVVGWSRAELGGLLDRGPTGAVGVTDRSLARGMRAAAAAAERTGS